MLVKQFDDNFNHVGILYVAHYFKKIKLKI